MMTTRYSLTAEQQDQVKPILVSQQHQIQGLRDDTVLSREDRMAKVQTIRTDSNAKIKAVLNDDQKKQFEQDQLRRQATTVTNRQCGPPTKRLDSARKALNCRSGIWCSVADVPA
jgi:protein CpxP